MRHEVAVIGGGLAGLTVAAALGRLGVRVAIVEALPGSPPPAPEREFDLRVSTISPVSRRILQGLDAWRRIPARRCASFTVMRVWDRAGFGEVRFDATDAELPHLGYVVENRELVEALQGVCGELDSVRWYRPAALQGIVPGVAYSAVHTERGELEARLVVAADGARSRCRELAGVPARTRDYGQDALVATVRNEGGNEDGAEVAAWQRFLPTGPLAILPLPRGWSSIVWSTLPGHAAQLEHMPAADFALELASALEHRLGRVEQVLGRARFPLARVEARRYIAPRLALIGDAAHTIHPLAGQGVNLAILDAAALADVVVAQLGRGRDPGLPGNLRTYERSRRAHDLLVGDAMSAFHRVFTSDLALLGWMRNTGFALTQRSASLKRLFVEFACGLSGDLPSLATSPTHE